MKLYAQIALVTWLCLLTVILKSLIHDELVAWFLYISSWILGVIFLYDSIQKWRAEKLSRFISGIVRKYAERKKENPD